MSLDDTLLRPAAVFLCLMFAACSPEDEPPANSYDTVAEPEFDDPDTMNELDALEEQLREIEAEQDALDNAA